MCFLDVCVLCVFLFALIVRLLAQDSGGMVFFVFVSFLYGSGFRE